MRSLASEELSKLWRLKMTLSFEYFALMVCAAPLLRMRIHALLPNGVELFSPPALPHSISVVVVPSYCFRLPCSVE